MVSAGTGTRWLAAKRASLWQRSLTVFQPKLASGNDKHVAVHQAHRRVHVHRLEVEMRRVAARNRRKPNMAILDVKARLVPRHFLQANANVALFVTAKMIQQSRFRGRGDCYAVVSHAVLR